MKDSEWGLIFVGVGIAGFVLISALSPKVSKPGAKAVPSAPTAPRPAKPPKTTRQVSFREDIIKHCICINNIATGLGCPIIGQPCGGMAHLHREPAYVQTKCPQGQIPMNGTCVKQWDQVYHPQQGTV